MQVGVCGVRSGTRMRLEIQSMLPKVVVAEYQQQALESQ